VRIVASWVADNEPPQLPLDPAPSAPALMRFVVASAPGEIDVQDAARSPGDPERSPVGVESHTEVPTSAPEPVPPRS
jgi:hypothetical protein